MKGGDAAPQGASTDRQIQALSDWLVEEGLRTAEVEPLFAGFCEGLAGLGVPVWRGHAAMRTLHPEIRAVGYSWWPQAGIESSAMHYTMEQSEAFTRSPFYRLINSGALTMRLRLDGPEPPEFEILRGFRERGATDYYARLVPFGFDREANQEGGMITSWVTDRAGGFTDGQVAILDRLIPRLALALKSSISFQLSVDLLDTYVGREAGRRILRGAIRRGDAEVIRAALLYADLQGFTAAADTAPGDAILAMLNGYFDCIVPAVAGNGGEVLKFIGDGMLAAFALDGHGEDAWLRALAAAREALAHARSFGEERAADGGLHLPLHVALHVGDVHYGNIGSSGRQDFTVIGPAVNEVTRIEGLCEALGCELLVSERFAEAAAATCRGQLLSLGPQTLRGVAAPQELFTLREG